jgi:hypothetical protein
VMFGQQDLLGAGMSPSLARKGRRTAS